MRKEGRETGYLPKIARQVAQRRLTTPSKIKLKAGSSKRLLRFMVCGGLYGLLALDGVVDLFAVDRNVGGGFDAEADFVAPDAHDGNLDVVADEDGFIE
jgi:hypothetical protein